MNKSGAQSKCIVIHFTTVHSRTDTRIRIKQTASLAAQAGYQVALFVQDGQGDNLDEMTGVEIIDSGPKLDIRPLRMVLGALRMWQAVRKAKPNVAHFHDPELIPVGLLLKFSGIKIVYDVHEDVPRQILGKYYFPAIARRPIAWAMDTVEWIAGRCFDAIVPATPKIAERFPTPKTIVIKNYPIQEELDARDAALYPARPPYFAFVGSITKARGVIEMVDAIGRVRSMEARLQLAGAFNPMELRAEVECLPGWGKVDFLGWVNRGVVAKLLGNVRGGLVVLHPTKRYPDAYPVKMFEYMAAGLPVIASDFALWREIVEGAGCGLLVDPQNPDEIAGAMQWILDNPQKAEVMGSRGRQAVMEKYNWERESEKLILLYEQLLKKN